MESIAGEFAFMAASAGKAFVILMDPMRLMYLGAGCMMGLVLGIIPGIGGLAGTAMLLPFTFNMDPYTAFALLLGLGSTTATGDPIPAILFGVPGGAASAATVLDGFPMAKKGEAGRALSAAYMSSLMGGVFGAFLMFTSVSNIYKGQIQGMLDCFKHWWLIVRCSWIGGGIGSIPGISASVVDWLAYGHALKTEKGANQTFGKGDVRGVIASESANNAKEGGALVPTVAFGVPGSATMAILLGAFLIHGLVPGPDMLTKNLSITYAMVWSVALANILGAGLCYAFSPQFAKLATLRYSLILPAVLGIIYIGAFEATRQWGDLFTLLFFGLVGWIMKQFKWPRPPLILGVVLGDTIERYMFISIERWGLTWMLRPVVLLLFALAFLGLVRPLMQDVRSQGGLKRMLTSFQRPTFHPSQLFTMFMIALIGAAVVASLRWDFSAKIVPLVVGTVALCAAVLSLFNEMCRKPAAAAAEGPAEHAEHEVAEKIHMDLVSDTAHLPVREIVMRAGLFFGYLIGFMAVMATIGLIPTVGLFVVFFMRYEAKERWSLVISYAVFCLKKKKKKKDHNIPPTTTIN